MVKSSLAFYNRLFLVPKPNGKWRPILDLSRLNLFLSTGTFKMETPETIRLSLKTGEWVTSLDFSDTYFHSPQIKKVSQVLPVSSDFPVHSPTIRFSHGSPGVHQNSQRGETDGAGKGYQDPPVPRRLVVESPFSGNLPTTYPDPLGPMSAVRLGSKYEQIRSGPQTGLQFCRLQVRPDHRSGCAHSGSVGSTSKEVKVHEGTSPVYGSSVHVLNRPADGYRKTSECRSSSHEAHSVAPEEKLAYPGSTRKDYSGPSVTASSLSVPQGTLVCVWESFRLHRLRILFSL